MASATTCVIEDFSGLLASSLLENNLSLFYYMLSQIWISYRKCVAVAVGD